MADLTRERRAELRALALAAKDAPDTLDGYSDIEALSNAVDADLMLSLLGEANPGPSVRRLRLEENLMYEQYKVDLELWCYDRALSAITVRLRDALGPQERAIAFRTVSETRELLGVAGYGNGGRERAKPGEKDAELARGASTRVPSAELEGLLRDTLDDLSIVSGYCGDTTDREDIHDALDRIEAFVRSQK